MIESSDSFDPSAQARFAVYFSPPDDSALAHFGARWLGRDAITDEAIAQPICPDMTPARLAELTARARQYGLHGTLKPPFALGRGRSMAELDAAITALARRQHDFSIDLEVGELDGFLAWLPQSKKDEIENLAALCVTELDDFRRPASAAELARRRAAGLTARQDELMLRWGYPYVLDEFHFHLTATDRLAEHETHQWRAMSAQGRAGLSFDDVRFDALCLFMQSAPGSNFCLIARYGFDGNVKRYAHWPAWCAPI